MGSDATADGEDDRGDITILGSVHLSENHFDYIQEKIDEESPDVVAIELDKSRLQGLFEESDTQLSFSGIFRQFSFRAGVIYSLLAYTQRRMSHTLGLDPGMNDMRVAAEAAIQNESRLALIDRDIGTTLERMASNMTPRTVWRVWKRSRTIDESDMPDGVMGQLFDPEGPNVFVEYRDLVERLIPEFTDAFIHERDEYMALRLYVLEQEGYDTVAVVGGAHEPGIRNELQRLREQPPDEIPCLYLQDSS